MLVTNPESETPQFYCKRDEQTATRAPAHRMCSTLARGVVGLMAGGGALLPCLTIS